MACGCTSACGCVVSAGAGIVVQRIADTFIVSAISAPDAEPLIATTSIGIPSDTTIVVFDGDPGSILELPPAITGMRLEVWNLDVDDDNVTVAAAAGDSVNGGPSIVVTTLAPTLVLRSVASGEWIANAF